MKKRFCCLLLAICMIALMAPAALAVTSLPGSGTEGDPYIISSPEEMQFFHDSVNSGATTYNASGVWVALGATIDMQGIVWQDGIGDGQVSTFKGCFDGNGHTIKNITIKPNSCPADGYQCAALFGYIYGNVIIKDLIIENPSIIGDFKLADGKTSTCAGVLVGFAYGNAVIEDVSVGGNIQIDIPETSGVGGLVGYIYGNFGEIKNCSVIGGEGSSITARSQVGGLVGYHGNGSSHITNCTVENLDITSRGYMSGLVGVVNNGEITGCRVEDINMTVTTNDSAHLVGAVAGSFAENPSNVTINNCSTNNVTVTYLGGNKVSASLTGGAYGSNGENVARIGSSFYQKLEDAVTTAASGDTIILMKDVDTSHTITIPEGANITLDLNGFTITGSPINAATYSVIQNKGNLIITDSSSQKNGKILCDHQLAGSTTYAVNTIANYGVLILEAGTIQNQSTASNQIGYAIDNYSGGQITINGGEVTVSGSSYYDGIRQFCNSETLPNSVTVNGGSVSSIWLQNPSDGTTDKNTKEMKGSVTIIQGTVSNLYLEPSALFDAEIRGGTVGKVSYNETASEPSRNLTGFIKGGKFANEPDKTYIADGYEAVQESGYYVIVKAASAAPVHTADVIVIGQVNAHYRDVYATLMELGNEAPVFSNKKLEYVGDPAASQEEYVYHEELPDGLYNLIIEAIEVESQKAVTVTTLVKLEGADDSHSVSLPQAEKSSIVEDDTGLGIIAGNVEKIAANLNPTEEDGHLEVKLTVNSGCESEDEEEMQKQAEEDGKEIEETFDIDLALIQYDQEGNAEEPTDLGDVNNTLIEILIPIETEDRKEAGFGVYRIHNDELHTLPYQGEYFDVDMEGKFIALHAKRFSSYAVAYGSVTPVIQMPVSAQTIVVSEGETATMSVTATNADTYEWQVNDGTGWKACGNSASYVISPARLEQNGYQYKCIVTSEDGIPKESPIFTLQVLQKAGHLPHTGDDAQLGLWLALMGMSLAGTMILVQRKRRVQE